MSDNGNEDLRAILVEQVERLLADTVTPDLLRSLEAGAWPAALWAEVEALGLPLALAPEALGGAALGWDDAVAVWQVLGRHAAPVPLAETMAAAGLLAASGLAPPAGPIAIAVPGEALAWGRRAGHAVSGAGDTVALHALSGVAEGRHTISRLPADRATLPAPLATGAAPGPDAALHASALLHAALIAGALESVLAMTVDYANTRRQFGRAIGGFQAVQQLLAQAAGEVAAAGVAASHAGRAAARRGLGGAGFEIGCAKVVTGEAATKVAAIAHQVHAAMGFTDEHALHLYTRRLWAWRDTAGAERLWARRIGEVALARGGAALWPDLTAREEGAAAR